MSTTEGRLSSAEVGKKLISDAPEKVVQGLLSNQDAIIDALKAIAAKLDADAGVTDTDYASTITDSLAKLDLIK